MKRRVLKRSGETVKFNKENIISTIVKAYKDVHPERGEAIAIDSARFVYQTNIKPWVLLQKERKMGADEIQNIVEIGLMRQMPEVARAYIIYNYEREVSRGKERVKIGSE